MALRHVVRQTRVEGEVTAAFIAEWHANVIRWHREVYTPIHEALMKALPSAQLDADWLETNRGRFEPAITDALISASLGFTDVDRDRKLMALGRAMHEEDSTKPRATIPTSVEELAAYFGLLCKDGLLWDIDASGAVVLRPLAVKTALDAKLTRTGPGPDSVEARTVPGTDHVGADDWFDPSMREAGRDEVDPLSALADLDLARTGSRGHRGTTGDRQQGFGQVVDPQQPCRADQWRNDPLGPGRSIWPVLQLASRGLPGRVGCHGRSSPSRLVSSGIFRNLPAQLCLGWPCPTTLPTRRSWRAPPCPS